MDKLKSQFNDEFFEAILTLENIEECYKFFSDVCTPKEIDTIAQRYTVATMLKEGKVYNEIVRSTGASTATVSRVKRSMGVEDNGYKIVFERLGK